MFAPDVAKNWPAFFERRLITTDHVTKRFGDCTALAPAYFGVDERQALGCSLFRELAHRTGMNGTVNGDYAASFGSAEYSTFAKECGFDLRVVHDDDFDDFSMCSDFIGRTGRFCAQGGQFAHRLGAQVIDHQIESCLREIDRHRFADIAQADKTNGCGHR